MSDKETTALENNTRLPGEELEREGQFEKTPSSDPHQAQEEILSDNISSLLSKKLHDQAEYLVKDKVNNFASSLIYQAKLLAFQRNDDMVLSNHILEALEIIQRERQRKWTRERAIFAGSALFGSFFPGILTEFSKGKEANFLLMAMYIFIGFVGYTIASWGFNKN